MNTTSPDSTRPVIPQRTVGMDMFPPYGVYLDGDLLAEHPTEREAQITFDKLAKRSRAKDVFVGQSH
jgi:hypothetical protein